MLKSAFVSYVDCFILALDYAYTLRLLIIAKRITMLSEVNVSLHIKM